MRELTLGQQPEGSGTSPSPGSFEQRDHWHQQALQAQGDVPWHPARDYNRQSNKWSSIYLTHNCKTLKMNEKINWQDDVDTKAHCLHCMPKPNCQSWSPYVVTHYSSAVPFHLLPLVFSCPYLSPVCANQLLCWSVSKCLRCNLMKASSHKGGKLLPGNSTPQAVLFIFLFSPCWITLSLTSPQNKSSFMLVHSPRAYCQWSQT